MATLDSPLEALALEYASFGVLAVVNNVWTWIAVVTAAVSFWRIRFTASIGNSHGCGLLEELTGSISEHDEPTHIDESKPEAMAGSVEEKVARVKETVTKTDTVTEVWEPLMCDDGVAKGKLTMYYEVDVDVDGGMCADGELTAVNYGEDAGSCGEWWEKVVRMRNGDDGWYRHVDLTVINGNVVRLWDSNGIRDGGRCLK